MTDPLERFATTVCEAVNEAHKDGLVPQTIFDVLAAVIAATARNLEAKDIDVFRLFTGFAYGYRAMPLYDHATALREASPCPSGQLPRR